MQSADRRGFVAALLELAALKRASKDITEQVIGAWWNHFQDWELADFKAACRHLTGTVDFMPNPYHFAQLKRAALPAVAEQWARVRAHARGLPTHGGHPQEIPLGDPVLDAAVAGIGGYVRVAMQNTEFMHILERRFAEHYEALSSASETRLALPGVIATTVKQLESRLSPGCQRS